MLAIGKPYSETRTVWDERVEYNWWADRHELRVFLKNPQEREIASIGKGEMQFKLYIEDGVIFLLYKFDGALWSDCTYSWHLVPEEDRTIPSPEKGMHDLIHVTLVDAATGIVRALRCATLSAEFSYALDSAILAQTKMPLSREEHDRIIQKVYARYPTSRDMARQTHIRTVLGD